MRISFFTGWALVAGLACAPTAAADTVHSVNWAGYAVHRSGLSFRKVLATWRQPSASCRPGIQTFSAYWVGLGGYSTSSASLEQVGTEVDCGAAGRVISGAWYELVPAPSVTIRLVVHPVIW